MTEERKATEPMLASTNLPNKQFGFIGEEHGNS